MRALRVTLVAAGLSLAATLSFFEVRFEPVFRLPRDVERPDPAQERRYEACFEERDAGIHERAFQTIDNPDVQREYINARRERARAACREQFPQRMATVREPFRFNLVDLEPRIGCDLSF